MKMNRNRFASLLFLSISILLIFSFPNISYSSQEKRVALVIGNGKYRFSPLPNPANDADDMTAVLEKCGFTVIKTINATRKQMRKSIRAFGKEIASEDAIGLFYFSGHAIQVDGENYLIPIGASVYAEDEIEDECLKVSAVLRKMETASNKLNIIILDACRDNPFERSFRSHISGLAKMNAPIGSIYAFSTAPGSVAADGIGRNGLYTSVLLEHILTPGLEIGQLFRLVRVEVMEASNYKQVPWESSSLTGSFFFNKGRGIAVADRPGYSPPKKRKKKVRMIPLPTF